MFIQIFLHVLGKGKKKSGKEKGKKNKKGKINNKRTRGKKIRVEYNTVIENVRVEKKEHGKYIPIVIS